MTTSPTRRRWLTFSLGTFLIGSTLASLAIWGLVSWFTRPDRDGKLLPGGLVWRARLRDESTVEHGDFSLLDRNGRILATGRKTDDKATGRWRHYYPNGRLASQGPCGDGVPHELWSSWDERGNRRLEVTYEAREIPIPTELQVPGGSATKMIAVRSGPSREWWPGGRLKSEGAWRDDLRTGPWTFWNEAGQQTAAGTYTRDLREGEWQTVDSSGAARTVWYAAGHEIPNRDALLSQLTAEFQSGDREARFEAVEALGKFGAAAVPILTPAISDGDVPLALWTLRALIAMGPAAEGALPAIRKLRGANDPELRRESLIALFALDEAHRVSAFRELLLASSLADVAAAKAWHLRLASLGPSALPSLDSALGDDDPSVRLRALAVLSNMSNLAYEVHLGAQNWGEPVFAKITKLLERAQLDRDPQVARTAKEVLKLDQSPPFWLWPKGSGKHGIRYSPVVG